MKSFLSVFGSNARTSYEDNQYNFYNIFPAKLLCLVVYLAEGLFDA